MAGIPLIASAMPWLAVAGIGALHGLNPATGWALAAAWGVRTGDRRQAMRALVPMACGHASSVLLVAGVVAASAASGVAIEPVALQSAAAALLMAIAVFHLRKRHAGRRVPAALSASCANTPHPAHAAHASLALWTFIMSTAHGAGLMLVPALIPLCMGEGAVRELTAGGSLALGLAVVAVHMVAMLSVTGLLAAASSRAVIAGLHMRRHRHRHRHRHRNS